MFCSTSSSNHHCHSNNLLLFCVPEEPDKRADQVQESKVLFRNNENTTILFSKTNTIIRRSDSKNNNTNGRGMIDEVVVSALSSMGFEDRQRQLNEQHGVFDDSTSTEQQTPEFLAYKLNELDIEINKQLSKLGLHNNNATSSSSSSSPPGILVAQAMMKDYPLLQFQQSTLRLRLRLLKSEYWDTPKAASRMIRYFDLKLEAFGPTKVHTNITHQDLSKHDLDALHKGFLQYIPGRDTAGRRILVFFPSMVKLQDPKSLLRLLFYYDAIVNWNTNININNHNNNHNNNNNQTEQVDDEDDNNDDSGYIFIIFHTGPPSEDTKRYWKPTLLPIMPSVTHTCFYADNTTVLQNIKTTILLLSPELRAKIKVHSGSQTEWMYELMGFGIPCSLLPLSDNGEIKWKQHLVFIDYRKKLFDYYTNAAAAAAAAAGGAINHSSSSTMRRTNVAIEIPTNHDVLFGRGRPFQNHMGNVRLQYLVEEYMDRYTTAKPGLEKGKVVSEVISQVQKRHGRFLCQDHNPYGLWMPVDTIVAKEKVSQMFRNTRKKILVATTTTTKSTSSTFTTTIPTMNTTKNTTSTLKPTTTTSSSSGCNLTTTTTTRTTTTTSQIISPITILLEDPTTTTNGSCNGNSNVGMRVRNQKQKQNEWDENENEDEDEDENENVKQEQQQELEQDYSNHHVMSHCHSSSIKRQRHQQQNQQLPPNNNNNNNKQPQQYTFAGRRFYDVGE